MSKMLALAKPKLLAAQLLKPTSYLVALNLLNIAQFEGDGASARKYILLANSVYPDNFTARARYLIQLEPRWGGSYQEMDAFIEESQLSGVSPQRLGWLRAIEHEDQGAVLADGGDLSLAAQSFTKALVLSMDAGPAFRRAYLLRSAALCADERYQSKTYCQ